MFLIRAGAERDKTEAAVGTLLEIEHDVYCALFRILR